MTEVPPEVAADVKAALELVRVFTEHGHSVEAVQAADNASLLVTVMAMCSLASRVILTVPCPGCGSSVQVEHVPRRWLAGAAAEDHAEPDVWPGNIFPSLRDASGTLDRPVLLPRSALARVKGTRTR